MKKILVFLKKNMVVVIPAAMFLGVVYGALFSAVWLSVLIVPLTFLMVYPMMVTMDFSALAGGGDFKLQMVVLLINFCFMPFVAYFTGKMFFADRPVTVLGLLLAGLLPTSGMTISWTGFAKGNIGAAVKMTVIGLIAGSVFAPLYVKFLMGQSVDISLLSVFKQIIVIVACPMLAGFITRLILVNKYSMEVFNRDIKPIFPGISVLGVVSIVFVAMALKAKMILGQPQMLFVIIVPLMILYLFNFVFSTIVAKIFFNREDGIALVYGTVMRNLSIALAIVMTAFGKDAMGSALVVAIAYIVQVQSAAWYVKLTSKIFT